jgi:ketosteroid isomerase-like protein
MVASVFVGGKMTDSYSAAAQHDTLNVVTRFNAAVNAGNVQTIADLLSDDTVFENTGPAPDGTRFEGKTAVVEFWKRWLDANAEAGFEAEDVIVAGDRCIVQWIYRKMREGKPWHLRGIDVFRVRDGKIAAKLAYVKG